MTGNLPLIAAGTASALLVLAVLCIVAARGAASVENADEEFPDPCCAVDPIIIHNGAE